MRATIRSASGSATEIGVRPTAPCASSRASACASFSSDFAPKPLSVAQLVLGEHARADRRSTARRARRAAACSAFGPEPLDAQQRDHARRVLLRAAPRASATLPVSSSSRIFSAVLLPMPSIFCSSLARQLARGRSPARRSPAPRSRRRARGTTAGRPRRASVSSASSRSMSSTSCFVSAMRHGVASPPWRKEEAPEVLTIDGREVRVTQPEQALLLARRRSSPSSTSCATTSRSPTARCAGSATGRSCSSASSTAPRARRSTRSARPTSGPTWLRTVTLSFPVGAHRRGGGGRRRGRARLDREPRLHRAAPAPGARRRSRPPRRAARRSRSRARASPGTTCGAWRSR